MLSTIIFIITRGWHNRPGVAAVPIVSKSKLKKKKKKAQSCLGWGGVVLLYIFLTTALDEDESASRLCGFTRGERTLGTYLAPQPVWTLWRREKSLLYSWNRN
jgi:hypothetical protein